MNDLAYPMLLQSFYYSSSLEKCSFEEIEPNVHTFSPFNAEGTLKRGTGGGEERMLAVSV